MLQTEQRVITDPAEAMRLYDNVEWISFDLETGGLSPAKDPVHVIALAHPKLPPVVLHSPWKPDGRVIKWLETKKLIGHNMTAFDIPFIAKYGFDVFNSKGWIDTLVAEQMAIVTDRRSVRKDLGSVVKRRLGKYIDKKIDHGSWARPELSQEALDYVLGDITLLHQVYRKQKAKIDELGVQAGWQLERQISPVVSNMIIRGIPLDEERLENYLITLDDELSSVSAQLRAAIGTDSVNSSKQLITAIERTYGIHLPSTNEETLTKLKGAEGEPGQVADWILTARHARKRLAYDDDWKSKYVFNGRIHASYWQLGTDTSRFSSSSPNLQQWPRNMRVVIGFADGDQRIVKIDFSQLEIVVAAILMREKNLLDAALNGDVHSYVGSLIYNIPIEEVTKDLRRGAKAGSFTLLFAGGRPSLIIAAREQGFEMTNEMADDAIYHFFQGLPNAYAYISRMRSLASSARQNRYSVPLQIPNGPRRSLSGMTITASQLVNTLVQGSAASGLKTAMKLMLKAGIADKIIATVHDELVFECHKDEVDELVQVASRCMKLGMKRIIGVEPNVEPAADLHWQ